MKKFLSIAAVSLLAACASTSNADDQAGAVENVLYVNGVLADCQGMMPMKCMQVKRNPDQKNWEYFYSEIEGFDYQDGFVYKLRIKETPIANPPADASSVRFELIEVLEKKPLVYKK